MASVTASAPSGESVVAVAGASFGEGVMSVEAEDVELGGECG